MSAPTLMPRFEAGARQGATPLLLLHGTGGDENDPLPLGPQGDLTAKPALIRSGAQDLIVPAENAARFAELLRASHAAVEHRALRAGPALSNADAAKARPATAQVFADRRRNV
jgi:predicted esterase